MSQPVPAHTRFHELLSQRLDEPLTSDVDAQLLAHLEACPACRTVERDYRQQRDRLAALPLIPPPRDLWARTAAALDREMSRGPRRSRRAPADDTATKRGVTSPMLMLSSLASLAVAAIVVATQLGETVTVPPPSGPDAVVRATPFDVPTQELAFVDFSADGITVYQTQVSEVCPQAAIDCSATESAAKAVLRIPGAYAPRGLALHPDNLHLALLSEDARGEETISVVLLPVADPNRSGVQAGPGPDGIWRDPPGPQPTAVLTAPDPATPRPRTSIDPTDRPAATSTPRVAPQTPKPTRKPIPNSLITPKPPVQPTASPTPARLATPEPTATPEVARTPAPDPVTAILDKVRTAGAPAAWSGNGRLLAFSAMPADRSQGPDVYVWQSGEPKAHRVTNDHRSYFASWSGSRIVVSRISGAGAAATTRTAVLDPASGVERKVDGDGLWLPMVDPTGHWAVTWKGSLDPAGNTVQPRTGGLYLLDWSLVDPWREHKASVEGRPIGSDGGPGDEATPSAQTDGPDGKPVGRATAEPKRKRSGRPAANATPDPSAGKNGAVVEAIEPDRDETVSPVVDWQISWSDDGSTFGYWIADAPGANWGRLSVLRVVTATGHIDRTGGLLGPTLARRAFSLGADRVAWVAPAEDHAQGELRVRTWGSRGAGGLRLRDIVVDEGMPDF